MFKLKITHNGFTMMGKAVPLAQASIDAKNARLAGAQVVIVPEVSLRDYFHKRNQFHYHHTPITR